MKRRQNNNNNNDNAASSTSGGIGGSGAGATASSIVLPSVEHLLRYEIDVWASAGEAFKIPEGFLPVLCSENCVASSV